MHLIPPKFDQNNFTLDTVLVLVSIADLDLRSFLNKIV